MWLCDRTGTAQQAQRVADPISDVRGGAAYQQAMVGTLVLRGLREVWAQLGGGAEEAA